MPQVQKLIVKNEIFEVRNIFYELLLKHHLVFDL